jgi:hypothetical protein
MRKNFAFCESFKCISEHAPLRSCALQGSRAIEQLQQAAASAGHSSSNRSRHPPRGSSEASQHGAGRQALDAARWQQGPGRAAAVQQPGGRQGALRARWGRGQQERHLVRLRPHGLRLGAPGARSQLRQLRHRAARDGGLFRLQHHDHHERDGHRRQDHLQGPQESPAAGLRGRQRRPAAGRRWQALAEQAPLPPLPTPQTHPRGPP